MDQHVITTDPQALAAVPQMDQLAAQEAKAEETRKRQKRFQMFGAGSFLYALFYTFCLYRNAGGLNDESN